MKSFDDGRLAVSYQALRVTYILVPLLAGLDKFTNLLTNWSHYLSPAFARMIPMSPTVFMYLVGIVEIVAALLVMSRRTARVGANRDGVAALIAINLLTLRLFDIAVRDVAMAVGAFALALLEEVRSARRGTSARSTPRSGRRPSGNSARAR